MKKLLTLLLALSLILSFAACGKKPTTEPVDNQAEIETPETNPQTPETKPEEKPAEQKPAEQKPAEQKPAEQKPAEQKPAEQKPAEQKPAEQKPAEQKPAEQKPVEQKPEEKPVEAKTIGTKLLASFKAKASGKTPEQIVEGLSADLSEYFRPATMAVSEGFLNGFNNEIQGFSEGVMFGPVIGTIPFVGYVFKLPAGADANTFISTLKKNANMRWNICTEAEEMVTGAVGQTVFFVMCPASFEE